MLGHNFKNPDSFKQWLNKLFPIGTQVYDRIGIDYSVTGWRAANDRVHIRLTHNAGTDQLSRDVPFDQIMCWARFLPEPQNQSPFDPNSAGAALAVGSERTA